MSDGDRRGYTLTPEHEAALGLHREKWRKIYESTEAMTEEDRVACTNAIHKVYRVANLPALKHVVFVPSAIVAAMAGGFAAAIWYVRRSPAETYGCVSHPNTLDEVTLATLTGFELSIYYAVHAACGLIGQGEAHLAYVRESEGAASTNPWMKRTWTIPYSVKRIADLLGVGKFGLMCAERSGNMAQGWDASRGENDKGEAFFTFFQDVAKLNLPEFANYQHWRTLAERSSYRIVHEDFAIISDRPESIVKNNGIVACRWRDGTEIRHTLEV